MGFYFALITLHALSALSLIQNIALNIHDDYIVDALKQKDFIKGVNEEYME